MKVVTFMLSGNEDSIKRVVRRMLDGAGFTEVPFTVADELDETREDVWRARAVSYSEALRDVAEVVRKALP